MKRAKIKNMDHEENISSEDNDPTQLIPKLCKWMYNLGWATGTGGGMSVRHGELIYMAPSGVQKEMIKPCEIFKCDEKGKVLDCPNGFKLTECAPLFMNAYSLRNASAVLHSHSEYAVLASLIFKGKEFRITHQEMLKGIKIGTTNESYKYSDTLVVPIVENVLYEKDLTERMKKAMEMYPQTNAVLVRRHGVYIWGNTWQRAKTQAECYHYLFKLAIELKRSGINPEVNPIDEFGITDQ